MISRTLLSLIIIPIMLSSCSSSKPKNMLEFYYVVPFGDKYNEVFTREDKEKLFNAGEWTALEDSGYAKLVSQNSVEASTEEIVMRVWNGGSTVAVTTRYEEGSDCPPIQELFLYQFTGDKWIPIELPEITVSDYWSNRDTVPEIILELSGSFEFEPFLDKNINGIKFEWRYYTCFDGSVEDVPDYYENEITTSLLSASDKKDYDALIFQWNSDFTKLERSSAEASSEHYTDINRNTAQPAAGLLLGAVGENGPITYFITFSNNGLNVKSLSGAILSPQQDNFFIIQTVNASSTKTCSYDEDSEAKEEECSSTASQILISKATSSDYNSAFLKVSRDVSNMANAECGYDEDQFEDISFIGRNFIQYVMGGSDSECAPGGPGGGFEKDTIVSFNGAKISMMASDYLNYSDLQLAYDKLFPEDTRKNQVVGLCEPDEMLINLVHEDGRLVLYIRNNSGRGYQDSWERDIKFSEAPGKFVTKEQRVISNRQILDGALDFFVSPDGKNAVVLKSVNETKRLYFYNVNNPVAIARISIPDADIVMEEWCDKNYWNKWSKAIDDAGTYVKIPDTD